MKAVLYEGNGKFELSDVAAREPKPNEVVIKVSYCGICGSDLHMAKGEWDERIGAFPRIIGHEASGEIVKRGTEVKDWKLGDRVVVRPLKTCGKCPACKSGHDNVCKEVKYLGIELDGAFQNYWTIDASVLHRCPDDLSLLHATLVEPLAVCCHAIQRSEITESGTAVVIGGGPIGLMTAIVLKSKGINVVVSELSQLRLDNCKKLGIPALNSQEENLNTYVQNMTDGYGVDVVFEASGSQAGLTTAPDLCHPSGRIMTVATYGRPMPVPIRTMHYKEIDMVTTRAYQKCDFDEALNLLNRKVFDCDGLISKVMPLGKLEDAIAKCTSGADVVKIIMDCQSV